MKLIILTVMSLLIVSHGDTAIASQFNHSHYDSVLQRYVANGLVEYAAIKENQQLLKDYLEQIEQVDPENFATWSKDERKAFWINAYNAITIEGIVRNYPIQWGGLVARVRFPHSSIRQIGGFWDTVFIKVMGYDITLNQIEHEILRKQFKDPRIHFVLVCAAMGCPLLKSEAFFSENLDQRLERAAYNFINNREKVRLDKEKKTLYLSSIFDWYKEDFPASENIHQEFKKYSKKEKGVVAFVVKYLSETDRKFIIDNQPKIKYLDYDWSLNEQR